MTTTIITDPQESSNLTPAKTFSLSVKHDIVNKGQSRTDKKINLAENWQAETLTIYELKDIIASGKAFLPSLVKDGYRKDENFISGQIIAIDIDNAYTDRTQPKNKDGKFPKVYRKELLISEALALPFVQKYCSLIYTSPSYTDEWERFRLVFVLPEPITDRDTFKRLIVRVCAEIPGSDHTTSITNLFYGNTNAIFPLVNAEAVLSPEWINEALAVPTQPIKGKKSKERLDSPETSEDLAEWLYSREMALHPASASNFISHVLNLDINPVEVMYPGARELHAGIFDSVGGNRSEGFHQVYMEALGWENLGITRSGSALRVVQEMYSNHFNDERSDADRFDRLVAVTSNPESYVPATYYNAIEDGKSSHEAYLACVKHALNTYVALSRKNNDDIKSATDHKLYKQWIDRKKFTADTISNTILVNGKKKLDGSQFVVICNSGEYGIIAFKAAMSLGKTEALCKFAEANPGLGMLMIGYRNALLLNTIQRLSLHGTFYHLLNDSAHGMLADPSSRIALCFDSLGKLKESDADDKVIILDEALSIMIHALLSSTVGKFNRKKLLDLFANLVKRSKFVIMMDGNMSDRVVDWIAELRGESPDRICKIENPTPAPKLNVEWINAVKEDDPDHICLKDKSPIFQGMLETLEAHKLVPAGKAKSIGVIADNQRLLEAYDRELTKLGYKTLRLDKTTTANHADIIKNIDGFLCDNHTDVLLMSPTCESGVDISIENYFVKCYALFHGVLGTDSQNQFLRRIRNCHDWAIWAAERASLAKTHMLNRSTAEMLSSFTSGMNACIKSTIENSEYESFHTNIFNEVKKNLSDTNFIRATEEIQFLNFERAFSKECLRISLDENASFTDIYQFRNSVINQTITETIDEIILERGKAVYLAPDISVEDAREIKKNLSSTAEDIAKAEKALLLDRLPGLEDSDLWKDEDKASQWIGDYLCKSNRQHVRALERFWLATNIDGAKIISQKDWFAVATTLSQQNDDRECEFGSKKISFRSFFGHDIRNDYAQIKALVDLGFLDLLGGQKYNSDSPEIQQIIRTVKRSKTYKDVLEKTPGKDYIGFVADLMRTIGVKAKSKQEGKGKDRGKRFYSFYAPNDQTYELEALEKAESSFVEGKSKTFDKVASATKELEKSNLNLKILEAIDTRMIQRIVEWEKPNPEDFDTSPIQVDGIPYLLEWLDTATYESFVTLWESGDVTAKNTIKGQIRILWNDYYEKNKNLFQFISYNE